MTIVQYLRGVAMILLGFLLFFTFVSSGYTRSLAYNPEIPADVKNLVNTITIDSPISYKNMKVYPLIAKTSDSQNFTFIDEAMKSGIIEIKEIGSGDVNNLKLIKNKSSLPVFIMSGEIVKGAKQDRVISNDLVLGKDKDSYTIAVYCVEQGRWVKKSEKFDAANIVASQRIRKTVAKKMSQSSVWSEVSRKNRSMGANTSTSNYRASYKSKEFQQNASKYIAHFLSLPSKNHNYTGAIIQIDNKFTNIDIFNNNKTFEKMWPKLIKAYAQDAVDTSITKSLPEISTANAFLKEALNAKYNEMANPGLGVEYKMSTSKTSGNALVYNNAVIHLALFTEAKEEHQPIRTNSMIQTEQRQNIKKIPNIISPRNQRR